MKSNLIRWIAAAVLLCILPFLLSSQSQAEMVGVSEAAEETETAAAATLPLDQKVPGCVPLESGWTTVDPKDALTDEGVLSFGTAITSILKQDSKTGEWAPTGDAPVTSEYPWIRYEDPTISVRTEYATVIPSSKYNKGKKLAASITYIKVADASQVRTAMSDDKYDKRNYVSAETLAKHVNAVAAVNGDFFKYHYNTGYVLRQGEFYRDKLNGKRDLLLIDDQGNFHAVYAATSQAAADYIAALPEGRSIVNTFTLGPVLVVDGQARTIKTTVVADSGEFQWCYAQQRVGIVQVDDLEYAIVEVYGKTDGSQGMTVQEFADLIAYLFPTCRMAYNLDGGGSTNVVINGSRVHKTPGHRDISDILYFASAWTEE